MYKAPKYSLYVTAALLMSVCSQTFASTEASSLHGTYGLNKPNFEFWNKRKKGANLAKTYIALFSDNGETNYLKDETIKNAQYIEIDLNRLKDNIKPKYGTEVEIGNKIFAYVDPNKKTYLVLARDPNAQNRYHGDDPSRYNGPRVYAFDKGKNISVAYRGIDKESTMDESFGPQKAYWKDLKGRIVSVFSPKGNYSQANFTEAFGSPN